MAEPVNPAIRTVADFHLLGLLHDYLLSKTTADALTMSVVETAAPTKDAHMYTISLRIPKVKEGYFSEVIVPEVQKFFPHVIVGAAGSVRACMVLEGPLSPLDSGDPESFKRGGAGQNFRIKDEGHVLIDVTEKLMAELFGTSPLEKIYKFFGKHVGDVILEHFTFEKIQDLAKVWEKK